MAKTFISEGHAYREVSHGGRTYLLMADGTKRYLHDEHGIVYVGPPYRYTLDGKVLNGYTDEPVFIREYEEMWAEGRALRGQAGAA